MEGKEGPQGKKDDVDREGPSDSSAGDEDEGDEDEEEEEEDKDKWSYAKQLKVRLPPWLAAKGIVLRADPPSLLSPFFSPLPCRLLLSPYRKTNASSQPSTTLSPPLAISPSPTSISPSEALAKSAKSLSPRPSGPSCRVRMGRFRIRRG
jgi:hypothetical protein